MSSIEISSLDPSIRQTYTPDQPFSAFRHTSAMSRFVTSRRVLVAGFAGAVAFLAIGLARPSAQDLRERTLFVTVTDRMDNPVEGLDIDDLVVREDGVRREVLRLSRATEPLDVAVLVDNASSSGELIPRVRTGLARFVDRMTLHSVAIIALADRPTILVDYTSDTAALKTGIGRLFTMSRSGMTLFDGIVEVSDGLRRRESARAVIVPVVTDGIEFSNRRYTDVLAALTRSGAALSPITVGRFLLTSNDVDRDRSLVLGRGPDATGGRRFTLLTSNAVEGAFDRLASQLNAQYRVVYNRPDTLIPPEKIVVTASRPGLTVHGTPARQANGSIR